MNFLNVRHLKPWLIASLTGSRIFNHPNLTLIVDTHMMSPSASPSGSTTWCAPKVRRWRTTWANWSWPPTRQLSCRRIGNGAGRSIDVTRVRRLTNGGNWQGRRWKKRSRWRWRERTTWDQWWFVMFIWSGCVCLKTIVVWSCAPHPKFLWISILQWF